MTTNEILILTPVQEHYLKRELLKFQLQDEIARLDNIYALREFGYPFKDSDPKKQDNNNNDTGNNVWKTLTWSNTSSSSTDDKKDVSIDTDNQLPISKLFPMISYILNHLIMTFPLFEKKMMIDKSFWQDKLQVFFEHFHYLQFSNSYDREELTKRRKVALKLSKMILLLFNSGLGTTQEILYYKFDKFKILETDDTRQRSKIEDIAIPNKSTLKNLLTTKPIFINNWDINIISVVESNVIIDKNKIKIKKDSFINQDSISKSKSKLLTGWKLPKIPTSYHKYRNHSPSDSNSNTEYDSHNNKHHKHKHHYRFILKIKRKGSNNEFYVSRSYNDFKKFHKQLKEKYPGKKLLHLPQKNNRSLNFITQDDNTNDIPDIKENPIEEDRKSSDISLKKNNSNLDNSTNTITTTTDEDEEEDDDNHIDDSLFLDASTGTNINLPLEKMRTALRYYLRTICENEDFANSDIITNFLTNDNISKFDIEKNKQIQLDSNFRYAIDVNNLSNQYKFQKIALEKSLKLQKSMQDFKDNFLKNENYIYKIIDEIKTKTHVKDLSPILKDFFEWCKIYISSVIYQTFLGNDNSFDFYIQIKRFHKLVPYNVMAKIMKYTNALAVMKSLMDLFMAQPFGRQSLLQTMFSTILNDDIKDQQEAIKESEKTLINFDNKYGKDVIKVLRDFVFKKINDDSDSNDDINNFDIQEIEELSKDMNMPIVIIILMKNMELGKFSNIAFDKIIESYMIWKNDKKNSKKTENFTLIHDLFQLYINERDIEMMKQLWKDPELLQLIKSLVALCYDPMVRVFKIARMDIALKNFEYFFNDIIVTIDKIIDGTSDINNTQFDVVDKINEVLTNHEDSLLEFIHDVYLNDSQGIFEGVIAWVFKLVKFLQHSKFGENDTRLNLCELLSEAESAGINVEKLKEQLDKVIEHKVESRTLYKKLLDSKVEKENDKNKKGENEIQTNMNKNWEHISNLVMSQDSMKFGMHDSELIDLDLDTHDFDNIEHKDKTDEEEQLNNEYMELLKKTIDESEIEKLRSLFFSEQLRSTLQKT